MACILFVVTYRFKYQRFLFITACADNGTVHVQETDSHGYVFIKWIVKQLCLEQGLYNVLKSNSQLVGSILRLLSDQVEI